jgi:hypothetical protein
MLAKKSMRTWPCKDSLEVYRQHVMILALHYESMLVASSSGMALQSLSVPGSFVSGLMDGGLLTHNANIGATLRVGSAIGILLSAGLGIETLVELQTRLHTKWTYLFGWSGDSCCDGLRYQHRKANQEKGLELHVGNPGMRINDQGVTRSWSPMCDRDVYIPHPERGDVCHSVVPASDRRPIRIGGCK